MTAIRRSFFHLLLQLKSDLMLFVIPFVPFLAGAVFRFGIPFAEQQLTSYLDIPTLFTPYYPLLDALLVVITPILISFSAALVILDEYDNGIISYLSVTPLSKRGYLWSRLGTPMVASFPLALLVTVLFHLTTFQLVTTCVLAVVSILQSGVYMLMIVALSGNKVEGLAVGKLTSLLSMGVIAPYVLTGSVQYLFAATPAFWLGKFVLTKHFSHFTLAMLISLLYLAVLLKKFMKKIR